MRNDEVIGHGSRDPDEHWCDSIKSDLIFSEAAAWFTRLSRPEGMIQNSDISEFREWKDKDVRHAAAFVRLVEISYKTAMVPVSRLRDLRASTVDYSDGTEQTGKKLGTPHRRWAYAIAASVALAISAVAALVHMGAISYEPYANLFNKEATEEVFETPVGDNRTFVLADGSRVTLGGHTRVGVVLTKNERTVRLARGEAYFEVEKDPHRSFIVYAGTITVTAVGTAFNVRQSERSIVTVTEGRVIVEPLKKLPSALPTRRVYLHAGEQSMADKGGIGAVVKITDLASILSWRSGRLSFRQLPLRDAILDVNRYTRKPLVLDTPELGDILVTGTVMTSNVAGWTKSLERAFGLRVTEEPDRISIYAADERIRQ